VTEQLKLELFPTNLPYGYRYCGQTGFVLKDMLSQKCLSCKSGTYAEIDIWGEDLRCGACRKHYVKRWAKVENQSKILIDNKTKI
jgi:hypothetical protein